MEFENSIVKNGEVSVGETYPLYGMITKIISETPKEICVEINHQYHAVMHIPEPEKIELLKERAFEPGIFVAKVLTKDPIMLVEVTTVVFGKRDSTLTT